MRKIISCIATLMIMFGIIWITFTLFIPQGSWLNLVDGRSMEPTLKDNQIIFTDISEGIDRGDMITARICKEGEEILLIKRVIGLPNETVTISEEGVFVDGQPLVEDYLSKEAKETTYRSNGRNSVVLENDEYYLMGDNRKVSYDSRRFGAIKFQDILYKQSETPTANFWKKTASVSVILVITILLYIVIEELLIRLLDKLSK